MRTSTEADSVVARRNSGSATKPICRSSLLVASRTSKETSSSFASRARICSRGGVPELHAVIASHRQQKLAIRRKLDAEDPIAVAVAGHLHGTGGDVPDAQRPVPARRRQSLAVRREVDRTHLFRMTQRRL